MEDANTRQQIFLPLFKLGIGPLTAEEFTYNLASWKNRDESLKEREFTFSKKFWRGGEGGGRGRLDPKPKLHE